MSDRGGSAFPAFEEWNAFHLRLGNDGEYLAQYENFCSGEGEPWLSEGYGGFARNRYIRFSASCRDLDGVVLWFAFTIFQIPAEAYPSHELENPDRAVLTFEYRRPEICRQRTPGTQDRPWLHIHPAMGSPIKFHPEMYNDLTHEQMMKVYEEALGAMADSDTYFQGLSDEEPD